MRGGFRPSLKLVNLSGETKAPEQLEISMSSSTRTKLGKKKKAWCLCYVEYSMCFGEVKGHIVLNLGGTFQGRLIINSQFRQTVSTIVISHIMGVFLLLLYVF